MHGKPIIFLHFTPPPPSPLYYETNRITHSSAGP